MRRADLKTAAAKQAAKMLTDDELQHLVAAIEAHLVNTPELHHFTRGVALEALHQRQRWPGAHDAGKTAADWFWLVGYLAGKALHALLAGDRDKALHHMVTTAAALANWHAHTTRAHTAMRPGIDPGPVEPPGGA